jgi:glycosyltransferase involved in cell wall biosynthesis
MQREEISNIVREVLKEKGLPDNPVEKPVPKRIQRPRSTPAVLNVFHPGIRKLEQALEQVRLIENIAARSSVFTVNSARQWVCGDDVKEKAGSRCILDTVKPEGLEKALQKADILVLPTFCFKTAAKVAQLISDNQETAIVLSALIQGIPVLATRDGFTLLDTISNQGIREEIKSVIGKLESFGMVFCETDQLAAVFQKMVTNRKMSVSPGTKKDSSHGTAPGFRLITAKDIQTAVFNNQDAISLAPGGIITPLAKDQAKEYSIRIIQTGPIIMDL